MSNKQMQQEGGREIRIKVGRGRRWTAGNRAGGREIREGREGWRKGRREVGREEGRM